MKSTTLIRKYPAKKGKYLYFIAVSLLLPLIYIWLLSFQFRELIPFSAICFIPFLLLFWIYCTTSYQIVDQQIFYRSAFLRGNLDIHTITVIELIERPNQGIRPALASKGMIIHYQDSQTVFLAPRQPKKFLKNILKINNSITVIRKSRALQSE